MPVSSVTLQAKVVAAVGAARIDLIDAGAGLLNHEPMGRRDILVTGAEHTPLVLHWRVYAQARCREFITIVNNKTHGYADGEQSQKFFQKSAQLVVGRYKLLEGIIQQQEKYGHELVGCTWKKTWAYVKLFIVRHFRGRHLNEREAVSRLDLAILALQPSLVGITGVDWTVSEAWSNMARDNFSHALWESMRPEKILPLAGARPAAAPPARPVPRPPAQDPAAAGGGKGGGDRRPEQCTLCSSTAHVYPPASGKMSHTTQAITKACGNCARHISARTGLAYNLMHARSGPLANDAAGLKITCEQRRATFEQQK